MIESQCELGEKGILFYHNSYWKLNEGSRIPIRRHNYHSKTWVSPVQAAGFSCWLVITCRYDSIFKLGIFQTLPVALNPSGPLCILGPLPALPEAAAEQLHLLVTTFFSSFGFLRERHWKEGKMQSFCSVLLLVKNELPSWRHFSYCLINTSRVLSLLASLFVLALTGCASVDPKHVTSSSSATSHLSPL